jgi:hypothetical protein
MSSCPLKQFKFIFGVPGEGVHRYRFMDVALVDYILTLLLAILVTKLTKLPLVISTILMFVVGIVCHYLVGIQTGATQFLGLKC